MGANLQALSLADHVTSAPLMHPSASIPKNPQKAHPVVCIGSASFFATGFWKQRLQRSTDQGHLASDQNACASDFSPGYFHLPSTSSLFQEFTYALSFNRTQFTSV